MVFADEWLGRMQLSARLFIRDVEPERFFSYRIAFPASLVRAGGSFRMTATADGGCEIVQDVYMGFAIPRIGSVVDVVLRVIAPVREIRRHMR